MSTTKKLRSRGKVVKEEGKPSQRRVEGPKPHTYAPKVTWRIASGDDIPAATRKTKVSTTPKDANKRQVGGDHYKKLGIEVWDFSAANDLDPFQHSIIRYVVRWQDKAGIQDLEKAGHFLDKYIELIKSGYKSRKTT